jgi:hypothetical protein
MTLQTLSGGGVWVPNFEHDNHTVASNAYVIDASGEIAALIFRCPKDGTLDRFDALVGAVSNSPDNGLRFSFQGVSATTGLPDGTILGATSNAFVTYAHSVTTGWKSTNFGETVTVTRGQLIACVVDIPTGFTAGDNIAMSHIASNSNSGLPYGILATSTKQTSNLLIVAPHYTTGYVQISSVLPGIDTSTSVSYNSGTGTADEWGMGFQIPFPAKLDRVSAQLAVGAGGDFEVIVYGSDGTTVLATLAYDGDVNGSSATMPYEFVLQSELTLTANTTYRVTIRPTTANNVALQYFTFQSADLMATMSGGSNFYMTSQLNQGGSWTDYNSGTFRRPKMSLYLTALDDGAGGGVTGVIGG